MRRFTGRLLFLLALLLAACSEITGAKPEIPSHSVPFDPPAVFEQWWVEVQAASGIHQRHDRVRWFLVRGGLFLSEREKALSSGRWIPDGRIYLAEGWERDEANVKHEMLHELLRGDHEHRHPLFEKYDSQSCWNGEARWVPCGEVPDGY